MSVYLFAGCAENSSHASHDGHAHEHELTHHEEHDHGHGEHDHGPGEIQFKKEQAEAVGLRTIKVTPSAFTEVIRTSGKVMEAQGKESVMVATVPGVVTFWQFACGSWYSGQVGPACLEYSFKQAL
ncbi:efflux transporter, RND family, MFP subunit [gut metagenome]|uniref:Efflux transporter, RND family, MFP subunit n=1 Tax=gut metagenome TaxID=749906 RepID=J9GHZ6_9ZZZZ